MSIQAVAWVLEHSTTKGLDRLVLISLANHANEDGECWPSIERIAAEANTKPVQARRVIGSLEAEGHIIRQVNAAPDSRMRGDRKTNLYRLLDGGAQKCPPWMERATPERADGVHHSARTGGTSTRARATPERAPNHQLEPSVEPSLQPLVASDPFDEFWAAYPRHDERRRAQVAFARAIKRAPDIATIIDGARKYAADPNRLPQYTKQAPTWLNGDCWNDPPLPSRTGKPGAEQFAQAAQRAEARQSAGMPNLFARPSA